MPAKIGPGQVGKASVQKVRPGFYRANVRARLNDGTLIRVRRTGETGGEAKDRALTAAREEIGKGPKNPKSGDYASIRTIVERRLAQLAKRPPRQRPTDKTLEVYDSGIKRLLKKYGDEHAEVTPYELNQMMADAYEGVPTQHRTARVVLNGAYKDAILDGLVKYNPVGQLPAPRGEKREPRALTSDQVKTLIHELKTPVHGENQRLHTIYSDVVTLQYATGARIGEVCAIRWKDVEFEHNAVVVSINGTVVSGKGPARRQDTTKNKKPRTVRLLDSRWPDAVAMLRRRRRETGPEQFRVFAGATGGWLTGSTVQQRWNRDDVTGALGESTNVTTHWMRRTYVTERVVEGWTFDQIAAVVGHDDKSVTRRIYTEFRPQIMDA